MGENWHSERSASEDHVVFDARGAEICTVPRDVNHSAQIAHLIASAPDLKAENERLRERIGFIANEAENCAALIDEDTTPDMVKETFRTLSTIARNALGEKSDG